MGACVSFSRSPPAPSAADSSSSSHRAAATVARVVNLDGSMAQLAVPATAREALAPPAPVGDGRQRASSSSPPPPLFLCSSDELGFDAPPRALAADEALQPGQLYFVFPASALRRPLSANDMAALAVKAATALAAEAALSPPRCGKQGGKAGSGRQSTARVAPLLVAVSKESRPDGDSARESDVHGVFYAARPAVQEGDRTVRKTRKGAAGYRAGGPRRRAVVQRLSAIAEDGE